MDVQYNVAIYYTVGVAPEYLPPRGGHELLPLTHHSAELTPAHARGQVLRWEGGVGVWRSWGRGGSGTE